MLSPSDNDSLVQRLKNGEDAAYKELYEQHYAVLCHYAASFLQDDVLAESIVSDVIYALWQNHSSISVYSSIRAYLMTAVRNRCLNHLRRASCQPLSQIYDQIVDSNGNPLGRMLDRELENTIMAAMSGLPSKTKSVFELSRFEHKSYEEISAIMNMSPNTVKYHISQALRMLNEKLKKYFDGC